MSFLLALLAQVGPAVSPGVGPPLPSQTIPEASLPTRAPPACPDMTNPVDTADAASEWLATAKGAERAKAGECLGVALSTLERWDEAASAFQAARADADRPEWRARLGAMAGEAALHAGEPADALAAFDAARADAAKVEGGGDAALAGGIALFRARALVALDREAEAAVALEEARKAAPNSAQAWLLSATLSRRMGKLAEAQQQIERAFDLRPVDLQVGVEAGVIAVLSGRDEAARKSWQSVVSAAPDSAEAATARDYLAQLGGASARPMEEGR